MSAVAVVHLPQDREGNASSHFELWNEARGLLRKTAGDLTDAVDEAITRCISQLAESAAEGEAARYSHDEHDNRLPVTQEFLDLANVKTVLNRVHSYLSWMHDKCVEREGQRRDWEREQESW